MKYRKKPVVIEAVRWFSDVISESTNDFLDDSEGFYQEWSGKFVIPTLEGNMRADHGDWIIKGVQGEFYPCKPDIFEATYDAVEEQE